MDRVLKIIYYLGFLCHEYLDWGMNPTMQYGLRLKYSGTDEGRTNLLNEKGRQEEGKRNTPKKQGYLIRDLKDEKKFYSWKGTRRETMMKKENVCKRRTVDMAKYKTTGVSWASLYRALCPQRSSLPCGFVVPKYNSCTRNLLMFLSKCRFPGLQQTH